MGVRLDVQYCAQGKEKGTNSAKKSKTLGPIFRMVKPAKVDPNGLKDGRQELTPRGVARSSLAPYQPAR